MERLRWSLFYAALSIAGFTSATDVQGKVIDTQRSFLVIHVGKADLLSAAAHEHWINAPIASGSVDDASATPGVRFVVEAAKLAIMADKNGSSKDLPHVQFNMQTKVLESSKYPDIVFQSTRAQGVGGDNWKVDGNLTLHGVTRPVTVDVKREKDAYVGTARIKQTDFGIQPIQSAGGL
jgi:hypothetical protein